MNASKRILSREQPGHYEIHIHGRLDKSWSSRLGGMTIQPVENSDYAEETMLQGETVDQAALLANLNMLYSLGYVLLSVRRESPSS